jgi:hypothetical protein
MLEISSVTVRVSATLEMANYVKNIVDGARRSSLETDIVRAGRHVRKVPNSDIGHASIRMVVGAGVLLGHC